MSDQAHPDFFINAVSASRLRPGDKVLLATRWSLEPEQVKVSVDALSAEFPGVTFVIVTDCSGIAIGSA